jgi:hypothetical protein
MRTVGRSAGVRDTFGAPMPLPMVAASNPISTTAAAQHGNGKHEVKPISKLLYLLGSCRN